MVLRLESSGAQPAIISSSYTSESQARHREQLDSNTWARRPPRALLGLRLCHCPHPAQGVVPTGQHGRGWEGSSLPGRGAARTQGCR